MAAASALVQDKIEQLQSLDPTTNPADLTAGTHQDPGNPLTASGVAGGQFVRSWRVTRNSPGLGLAQVIVGVTWSTAGGHSMNGVTYVCITSTCS